MDMTENSYAPGTYAKGDDVRVANTSRDAVALVFEGFKPVADEPVAAEPKVDETPTPTPTPVAPRPVAPRNKSQEDDKS
jgi:hypothetical protein